MIINQIILDKFQVSVIKDLLERCLYKCVLVITGSVLSLSI